jgi:hypothetical protein
MIRSASWVGPFHQAVRGDRRSKATTPARPIMHAVLHGVDRDQFKARHKANHLNVAYAPDDATADKALAVKAAFFLELGVRVQHCGV